MRGHGLITGRHLPASGALEARIPLGETEQARHKPCQQLSTPTTTAATVEQTYARYSSSRVGLPSSGGTPKNSHTRGMTVAGLSDSSSVSMINSCDCADDKKTQGCDHVKTTSIAIIESLTARHVREGKTAAAARSAGSKCRARQSPWRCWSLCHEASNLGPATAVTTVEHGCRRTEWPGIHAA